MITCSAYIMGSSREENDIFLKSYLPILYLFELWIEIILLMFEKLEISFN